MYQVTYWCQAMNGPVHWFFKNKPSSKHLQDQITSFLDDGGDTPYISKIESELREAVRRSSFAIVSVDVIQN